MTTAIEAASLLRAFADETEKLLWRERWAGMLDLALAEAWRRTLEACPCDQATREQALRATEGNQDAMTFEEVPHYIRRCALALEKS